MRSLVLSVVLTMWSFSQVAYAGGDPEAGKLKAYTCTGCHGIPGYKNSYPMYKVPKIGGQNIAYLKTALSAYRSGTRRHPTMMLHAESLSEADIDDITAWVSTSKTAQTAVAAQPTTAGPENVQLCQTCHGADGRGADPAYPVLAGQHSSYIKRALMDYRSGSRENAIMGGFAANLSDREIEDLAQWYSSMEGLTDLSGR